MVTCMDEKLILLSDGTLVAMTLKGCDPEWIKLWFTFFVKLCLTPRGNKWTV